MLIFRSSRSKVFFKIGVLKNLTTFTEKHLCWTLQVFFYRNSTVADSWIFAAATTFFQLNLVVIAHSCIGFFFELLWKHWKKQPLKLFCKKGVLRNFASFTEKRFCWSLFLIELQTFRPASLLKRDSNIDAFLWDLQNF